MGYSITTTIDSSFIFTGEDGDSFIMSDSNDVFLYKADSTGNFLWNKTYGGSLRDVGYFVRQTSDNGFIISGFTESFGIGGKDIYLIKIDNNGIITSGNEIEVNKTSISIYPNPGFFYVKINSASNEILDLK